MSFRHMGKEDRKTPRGFRSEGRVGSEVEESFWIPKEGEAVLCVIPKSSLLTFQRLCWNDNPLVDSPDTRLISIYTNMLTSCTTLPEAGRTPSSPTPPSLLSSLSVHALYPPSLDSGLQTPERFPGAFKLKEKSQLGFLLCNHSPAPVWCPCPLVLKCLSQSIEKVD